MNTASCGVILSVGIIIAFITAAYALACYLERRRNRQLREVLIKTAAERSEDFYATKTSTRMPTAKPTALSKMRSSSQLSSRAGPAPENTDSITAAALYDTPSFGSSSSHYSGCGSSSSSWSDSGGCSGGDGGGGGGGGD